MYVSALTITIDKNGISITISIHRVAPVQDSTRQDDARNGDQINPSLNEVSLVTPSREHL